MQNYPSNLLKLAFLLIACFVLGGPLRRKAPQEGSSARCLELSRFGLQTAASQGKGLLNQFSYVL
jgi:hypothetical protein